MLSLEIIPGHGFPYLSEVNRNSSYTQDTNIKGLFMLPEEKV